jgi:hypothetical protein
MLADQGIETFHELVNEYKYPRDDRLRVCASEILSFFPNEWVDLMESDDEINSEITFKDEYFVNEWQLVSTNAVTVKNLREVLTPKSKFELPYQKYEKFELPENTFNALNPFTLARSALHAPRDRFYKYRILHGDIYCNKRMFKFRMIDTPYCARCPEVIETIKHVLWECPRAKKAWEFLNEQTKDYLGEEYIKYETVILGNPNSNFAMETIITWITRMIMSIDRSEDINNEVILARLKSLFHYEKQAFGIYSKKMKARWGNLMAKF